MMANKISFTKKSTHSIINLYELLDQVNLIHWKITQKKKVDFRGRDWEEA